jgi:DNA (cytosine-5)-methyltransferase 1
MVSPVIRIVGEGTPVEATVGSLFSGIEGLGLGLERAGFRVIWQAENDPFCSRVLARHWPDVPNLGDVTEIDWSTVERPDLVCGGFPCQDVSQAGAKLGLVGERSGLWREFARALRCLRPRLALVENVGDLAVRGLPAVVGDLAALGYDAEWQSIPAAALGAPHLRERLFVVAYPDGTTGGRPRDAEPGTGPTQVQDGAAQPRRRRGDVSDANGERLQSGRLPTGQRPTLSDVDGSGPRIFRAAPQPGNEWLPEPDVGRVAHGVPIGVVGPRLHALGNAVVPQVTEFIGRQLLAHLRDM